MHHSSIDVVTAIFHKFLFVGRRRSARETPNEHAQYGYMADRQTVLIRRNTQSGGENQPMLTTTFPIESAKQFTTCDAITLEQATDDVEVASCQTDTPYGLSTFETANMPKWPTSVTVVRPASNECETRMCEEAF